MRALGVEPEPLTHCTRGLNALHSARAVGKYCPGVPQYSGKVHLSSGALVLWYFAHSDETVHDLCTSTSTAPPIVRLVPWKVLRHCGTQTARPLAVSNGEVPRRKRRVSPPPKVPPKESPLTGSCLQICPVSKDESRL